MDIIITLMNFRKKVEQRIPVRISLKGNKPEDLKRMRAGFNVECEVKY